MDGSMDWFHFAMALRPFFMVLVALITTGILDVDSSSTSLRQTSTPVIPGNWWSRRINWGCTERASSSPCSASTAMAIR